MSKPLLIERGPLLNFSGGGFWAPHPHRLELVWHPSAEYRFQAMKSCYLIIGGSLADPLHDPETAYDHVMRARDSAEAKRAGRQLPRVDICAWTHCSPRHMLEALLFKFTQNSGTRRELGATGDRPLVEHRRDPIWGDNLDGTGKNLMGLALMHIREVLCR